MLPKQFATTLSANVTGLTNDTPYYFAVTAVNLSDGEQETVTSVSATPVNDTQGPQLLSILFNGAPLTDGISLSGSGFVTVEMDDPAGMGNVEFYFNGTLVKKDYSSPYSAYIDIYSLADGSYPLTVTGTDTLGNTSTHEFTLVVGLAPPGAPVITSPVHNSLINEKQITVYGTTDKYTDVTLYLDNTAIALVSVGPLGLFSISAALDEGENRIKAIASNRSGQSPESEDILIVVDTRLPDSPRSLTGQPGPDGTVQLLWQKPLNKVIQGFNLYRLDQSFTTADQAVKINTGLITTTGYTDLPSSEGTWYYRVKAVDAAGNESALSNEAAVLSDSTSPVAVLIQYASTGRVDPATGRHAPGRVNLTLEVSEPLSALPFLTLTPGGGIPRSVELEKASDLVYTGFFDILDTMPQGMAYAVFSARDEAGNRGTQITSGDRLLLDTKGPRVIRLDITPPSPVKNNTDTLVEVQIAFGLSEAIKPGEAPQIVLDIAGGRQLVPVTGLTEISPQTGEAQAWQAGVILPDDAGLAEPETLTILYTGSDDLDNVSTDISVNHQFQVYQGGLPPLEPPSSLTGRALPGGQAQLSWEPVEEAAGYQVFRQAPGEGQLTLIDTIDAVTAYTDTTSIDGTHLYSVATIRRENQEESVSGLCDPVSVDTDSVAPNPPVKLVLDMVAQGIRAQWEAPAFTESVTYSLYRSDQTQITSVDGMTPLAAGINQTMVIDPTPSPTDHCYVVTAVDETGNESLPSNSYYLNFDLLPVSTLQVTQKDYDPPQVSWSHADTTGKIAGYFLYIGKDRTGFKVNEVIMANESFTDYGFAGGDRSYTVIAVDTNDIESMSRFVSLPDLSASLDDNTVVKRGIMNNLSYTVQNHSALPVGNIMLKTELGGRTHQSESFSLNPGESKSISVVAGGYQDLADLEILTTTIEVTPNPGESAKIVRTRDIEVTDSLMVLEIKNEEFIRGGAGRVWFTLENAGAAEAEIVTAENGNNGPSSQIRYFLVDEDDNVLYSAPFKQSLGDGIITLPNKKTVARIPAKEIFTSAPMDLFVPANAADRVFVRLEIDSVYYHLGRADEVAMGGTRTRQEVSLKETSYYGEVTGITPEVSKGDEDIVITGRAVDRASDTPLAGASLNLIISVNGFERKIPVTTDEVGTFTHTFVPLEDEAGVFKVHAIHPDLLDRPGHASFIINQVSITPSKINLSIPKNYEQNVSIKLSTQSGTHLTNLRLAQEGILPDGIHLTLSDPVPEVGPDRTVVLNFTLWADNSADETGSVQLSLKSDESSDHPWGFVLVTAQFSESRPVLYFTPDHIETGVAADDIITETITLENKGLADMADVSLTLADENGNPVPSWIRLNTPSAVGTLKVGESRKVSISFLPGAGISQGLHIFYLTVESANYPETHIGLYPTVTASGVGNALFKVSDIYTGTFNPKNELVRGLSNARIRLQNELTLADVTAATDDYGETLFENLPAGAYKCRITADNHQEYTGRVWIKPGITVSKDVFLEYNLVTVEWEVNEITIQDKYEILLTATFETDVPAAVVVAEPLSVTLPDMEKGDVYHGEFILVNHGLIRADAVNIPIPESDENFQYEILAGLPDTLEAKQRITIPYRITCLKSLDEEDQTGGGCYTYRKCIPVSYGYTCANGETSRGATQHCFYKSGGICESTGSNGSSSSTGSSTYLSYGGTGTGTATSPAPSPTPMASGGQKCLPKPERQESFFDGLMDKFRHLTQEVGCSVNTVLREYNDDAVDLVVKVPGGRIAVKREYRAGRWQWDHLSWVMDGSPDDKKAYALSEYGPDVVTREDVPYKKRASGVYKQGTRTIERLADCEDYLGTQNWGSCMTGALDDEKENKYSYKDKHGNWHQYDSSGRMVSYGNRHGMIAALIYDGPDDKNPSGMTDAGQTQVLWFEYDANGNPARIYDAEGREVRYEFSGDNLTRVTDVEDKETTYEYDSLNNLTRTVDAAGRATRITYNDANDPVSVTDTSGAGHFFEYDYDKNTKEYYAQIKTSSGRIKEVWYNDKGETKRVDINGRTIEKINEDGRDYIIVDEKNNRTRKEYDENENLKKIIFPDGSQVSFEYDLRFNKVKKIIDPLGRVTLMSYDNDGNLVTRTEAKDTPAERTTSFTYDALGRVLTATSHGDADTEEAVTTFTYDGNGNLETVTDPMGHITQFLEYDSSGNLLKMEDARGHEWRFGYDAKGRMVSQSNPLGEATSYEYDGANNRTAVVNALVKRFEFEYDDHNNLVKAIDPLSKYAVTVYNTDHLPILVTDREGKQSAAEYDKEGRLLKTIDGAGNEIQYTYSEDQTSFAPSHIPVSVVYPTFTRTFTYDRMGRVTQETDTFDSGTSEIRTFTYDAGGNLFTTMDEQDRTTSYEYDELGRLVSTGRPDQARIIRTYDSRNNLIRLEDPNQGIQYFTYDRNNRLVKSARPMGEETAYEYDKAGNKTAVVDAKGQWIEYTWNPANRMTQVRYYEPGNLETPVKTIDFTHDALGNLATWNDGSATGTFTYDDLSRKLTETVDYGPFTLSHAYTYYANGAKKTFTGPDGNTTVYEYDAGNRLAGITVPGQGQISYEYNTANWNNPVSMLFPGGSGQSYTHDPLMRLKTITGTDPGQNTLMSRGYEYSPAGNITQKQTEHGDYTYGYDTLNRLTSALNPALSDEAYTYDDLGNRITDVKVTGSLIYNANNELENRGNTEYLYDDNGNLIQKDQAGSVTAFFYNMEDRLTRVEDGSGIIAEYGYDPFGRRLWKEVSGTRTYYHYSREGLVGEYDSAGNETKAYGWKPGSVWGTDPLYMKIGSEYYWYQNDHAGTPQKLTAASGLVVWDARYDSFGNCHIELEAVTNNLRFAGQYYDAETGLHYNLHRYYDPEIGRYLRIDPYGDGLNLYAYCFNKPNSLVDPSGLCAISTFKSYFQSRITELWNYLKSLNGIYEVKDSLLGSDKLGLLNINAKSELDFLGGTAKSEIQGSVAQAQWQGKRGRFTNTTGLYHWNLELGGGLTNFGKLEGIEGKAKIAAFEGKIVSDIRIGSIVIKGTLGGTLGSLGVEGKLGVGGAKLGFHALIGATVGVEWSFINKK